MQASTTRNTCNAKFQANYEALDRNGDTFVRPARIVHELPYDLRMEALAAAQSRIEGVLGISFQEGKRLLYGEGVWQSFFKHPRQAMAHPMKDLLMGLGCEFPLELLQDASRG